MNSSLVTSRPWRSPTRRRIASSPTSASRQPNRPHSHLGPPGSTIMWPNSPLPPRRAAVERRSMTIPSPMPRPTLKVMKSRAAIASPAHFSATASVFMSLSTQTGNLRRRLRGWARSASRHWSRCEKLQTPRPGVDDPGQADPHTKDLRSRYGRGAQRLFGLLLDCLDGRGRITDERNRRLLGRYDLSIEIADHRRQTVAAQLDPDHVPGFRVNTRAAPAADRRWTVLSRLR